MSNALTTGGQRFFEKLCMDSYFHQEFLSGGRPSCHLFLQPTPFGTSGSCA